MEIGIQTTEPIEATPTLVAGSGGSLVPATELAELCAVDTGLYNRTFFPKTFRQESPKFHREVFEDLEDPAKRFVALRIFRDGAKTTSLRAFTSKRIAYGYSRTILFVSKSEGHSLKSVRWLKQQVEGNRRWTDFFGLEKGSKWTDEEIQIRHKALSEAEGEPVTITVLAAGITGQIRGLNVDDYRPDLIVVDDPCDEENTATPEQRDKIEKTFFGALQQSLAPASECPDAKMVLLQTPLQAEDLIAKCGTDPAWHCKTFSVFNELGQSAWPTRYPTEILLQEKQEYAGRGQLAIWLREKECQIVSSETSSFKGEWLQYWETLPEHMVKILAIDPAPPPSDRQVVEGCKKKDYEVLCVVGFTQGNIYLLEYVASRGHQPEWTISKFFELMDKWKPLRARVEGVNYQRTLKWLLEQEMMKRRRFLQINCVSDKRGKTHRMLQAYSGPASQKRLFIHPSMVEFSSQFVSHPNVAHDDLLDVVAMAIDEGQECMYMDGLGEDGNAYSDQPAMTAKWKQAP